MTPAALLAFMRSHRLAVEASHAADGSPQAALVGIAVTDAFEIVFDTLESTRKARNLRADPRVAFVVGPSDDAIGCTVQLEGLADEPVGADLARIKQAYFAATPGGPDRESWTGITYFRVRPTWIRFSDFTCVPPRMVEYTSAELKGGMVVES